MPNIGKISQIAFYSIDDPRNTVSYDNLCLKDTIITENFENEQITYIKYSNNDDEKNEKGQKTIGLTGNGIVLSTQKNNSLFINTVPGTKIRMIYQTTNEQNNITEKVIEFIIDHTGKYVFDCKKTVLSSINIGVSQKSLDIINDMSNGYFIVTLY